MSETFGGPYPVVSGDTNDSIVKHFFMKDWAEIYNHPNNEKLRKKYKASDQIKPGEIIWVPSRAIQPTKTGTSEAVQQPIWRFFFNAHMHIQSNNCCPMPLEWGLLTKNIVGFPIVNWFVKERMRGSRKSTNEMSRWEIMTQLLGRLGKIGSLSTDLIAGVYMGDLKDTGMNEEMIWLVMDEEKFQGMNEKKRAKALISAGEELELEKMSADTDKMFRESFLEPVRSYYPGADPTMFNCALLMDMSLAHYWGQWHIPVMINRGDRAVYINDWCSVYVKKFVEGQKEFSYEWETPELIDGNVIEPKSYKDFTHIYAKATLDKDFTLGKALEHYKESQNKKPGPSKNIDRVRLAFNSLRDEELCGKEFVHIVDKIPDDTPENLPEGQDPNEIKWFEDYKLQMSLSEGAAVKYPLEFFLFYHYDPRRHCNLADAATFASKFAKVILEKHAFYTYEQDWVHENAAPTVLTPDDKMNEPWFWEKILKKTIITNKEAFDSLHLNKPEGIYWGVKTYPRLGYDPGDFVRYPQLRELYQECGSYIPLLAHCSRGPMGGADYYCYAKYDPTPLDFTETQKTRHKALTADPSNLDHTEYWFADTFAAPGNWEKVLKDFSNLRLCLAHFGGYDLWCQVGDFEDIEALYPVNPEIFPKGEEIKSDAPLMKRSEEKEKMRATLYYAWIKKIAELADTKKNVYTDLSYFHLSKDFDDSKIWLNKRRPDPRPDPSLLYLEGGSFKVNVKKLVAKNLIYLLNKFSNLKDKIIIGTDWYMIEREQQTGVGEILRNLFIVMNMVKKEVGFDPWHQFAVINPLKYLGLGEERNGEILIEKEKLEKYGETLKNQFKNDDWIMGSRLKTKIETVQNKIDCMVKKFSMYPSVPLEIDLNYDSKKMDSKSIA